ncbi:MAG TPA: arsenate reductase (thioredoxin) [Gammaproteobacteria bacterium]
MLNLLFLCTGNSCRSQMAEGWGRHFAAGSIAVQSAGIEAHGKNPRAIAVMAEAGIDISGQESTKVTPEMIASADVVVTVCGHADEHCPALPTTVRKIHWPLNDPAKATGTEEEIMAVFRASRDDIRERVRKLVAELAAH